jgi:hypothetical protein
LSQNRAVLLLVPAAAAIAAGLIALRLHFQPPTVPAFVVAGGDGESAALAGARFQIVAQPVAPVQGAIGARAFLIRGDEVRAWDPPVTVDRDGSVRIDGPVDALFAGVPTGTWDVALAVGRPEVLPTAPRDVLRAREDGGTERAAWRLVEKRVRLGG